jgi:target of rapamycin complex 2 subunit MAPKAP1
MPVRTRAGSSPIRQSNRDNGPSVLITSPPRPHEESRYRRGSLGAVETIKERARRDTTTSSDLSSENEFGPTHFRRRRNNSNPTIKASKQFATQLDYTENRIPVELDDEDSGGDSDSTNLSSDFEQTPGSPSFLDSLAEPSSPLGRLPPSTAQESPRKARSAHPVLSVLPPPRPISAIAPKSALAEAIKKSRLKKASPLEIFASLSETADQKPLVLKIYAPFSKEPERGFDVLIRRTIQQEDKRQESTIGLGTSPEREVTVHDVIGLSLWRYTQEKREPPLTDEQMNANQWLLQMAEDGEPDEDLVLERTKIIASFTSNNNQRAARGARARGKAFDEFALIEATEEQFKENERLTPNVQPEAEGEDTGLQQGNKVAQEKKPEAGPQLTFQEKLWKEFGAPMDTPQPSTHSHPRMGAPKILRIHLHDVEPFATSVSVDVRTDTYLAEVLEIVCKKRHLDKAQCVLKVRATNIVVPLDRTVEALGDINELDLFRRRFADGLDTITGSPGSISPNAPLIITRGKMGGKGITPLFLSVPRLLPRTAHLNRLLPST